MNFNERCEEKQGMKADSCYVTSHNGVVSVVEVGGQRERLDSGLCVLSFLICCSAKEHPLKIETELIIETEF